MEMLRTMIRAPPGREDYMSLSSDSKADDELPGQSSVSRSSPGRQSSDPAKRDSTTSVSFAEELPELVEEPMVGSTSSALSAEGAVRAPRRARKAGTNPLLASLPSAERDETHGAPSDRLAFVEKVQFQILTCAIILGNTAAIGLETDIAWPWWDALNHFFLLFFVVELILRWIHAGAEFLGDESERYWNLFDVVVVGVGAFEACLRTVFMHRNSLLRMLRMFRLLRIFRMLRMFHYLQKIADAILQMSPAIAWIFTILFFLCYITAIVLTHLLGHSEGFNIDSMSQDDLDKMYKYFRDVPTTMFTLFRILTLDTWHNIAYVVERVNPIWRLFFVVFIACCSWTMMSLLTAVVSDYMITQTSDHKDFKFKKDMELKQDFSDYLLYSFVEADTDGSGTLDRDEFQTWIMRDDTKALMHKVGVHIGQDDFLALFDILDFDESGELEIEEFVNGFERAQEVLGVKHLLALEHIVKRVAKTVEEASSAIEQLACNTQKVADRDTEGAIQKLSASVEANEASREAQRLAEEATSRQRHDQLLEMIQGLAGTAQAPSEDQTADQMIVLTAQVHGLQQNYHTNEASSRQRHQQLVEMLGSRATDAIREAQSLADQASSRQRHQQLLEMLESRATDASGIAQSFLANEAGSRQRHQQLLEMLGSRATDASREAQSLAEEASSRQRHQQILDMLGPRATDANREAQSLADEATNRQRHQQLSDMLQVLVDIVQAPSEECVKSLMQHAHAPPEQQGFRARASSNGGSTSPSARHPLTPNVQSHESLGDHLARRLHLTSPDLAWRAANTDKTLHLSETDAQEVQQALDKQKSGDADSACGPRE